MNDTSRSKPFYHKAWVWGEVILFVLVALLVFWSSQQTSTPVARDAVAVSTGLADESACADCHEQAETFWQTGHAHTLTRASHPRSAELLEKLNAVNLPGAEQTTVEIEGDDVLAINEDGETMRKIALDWCFGSGEHAVTWVGTMNDNMGATDLLEFRWSWFRQIDGFALTPAQPSEPEQAFYGKLGHFFDGPKAARCFSCHATVLPKRGGAIDEAHILPGVTCQRCHGPRQAHVESQGAVTNDHWKPADRMEAVQRCAQCHRNADEQDPETIRRDNIDIVRFQPVGLAQSPCFINSQMTCTTCHDPHKPLHEQDSKGIWQCVQCHNPQQPDHVLCGAEKRDHCLKCHMPAIQMDAPMEFTDHWIRVREDAASER